MTIDTALWKVIFRMPSSLKVELLHYAEYLLSKYAKSDQSQPPKRCGFGSWSGQIVMSEDFDEVLEDMKDYM